MEGEIRFVDAKLKEAEFTMEPPLPKTEDLLSIS